MAWSLAVTAPCREAKVSAALRRFSFDHYVFRLRRQLARNGRVYSVLVPAFPSYVFVAARSCWDFIRHATDVVDFVRFGGVIAEIPDVDVASLVARSDKDFVLPQEETSSKFRRGQHVVITGGAIQGPATFDRMASPGRAIVLVDGFGRMIPVSVSECDLSGERQVRRAKHHRPKTARVLR